MIRRCLKNAVILLVTGTLVSATQAAMSKPLDTGGEKVESCFSEEGMFDLSSVSELPAGLAAYSPADTLETYEIELEDESGKGVNYKAIIGFAIAAAFIGYAIYIMIAPEDEEEADVPVGKEPPVALFTIPFGG